MKRVLMAMTVLALGATPVLAQTAAAKPAADAQKQKTSLADARAKIDEVIANPKLMTSVLQGLSAEDQQTFLADVNAAIAKMPGSNEEKVATYLDVNAAAMRGAAPGNLKALVGVTFATVPPEALPTISENFAENLFNRSADTSRTYTDAEFIKIANETMAEVNERTANVDNTDVRSTFAALMFIRASNVKDEERLGGIIDGISTALPEKAREPAKKEWIQSALNGDYEPMMATADAEMSGQEVRILRVSGPQNMESLLADLTGASTDPLLLADRANPVVDAVLNPIDRSLPNLGSGEAATAIGGGGTVGRIEREVEGYQDQVF